MADIKEISEFLQKGRAKNVKALVAEALEEGQDPKVILNDGLLAGMMVIGEKFKNNEVFVPEVLVAARALNAGLTILEPKLIEVGNEPVGKVVIGTVKGDLHDIGKNLVAMMMKGVGFEVIDLGVDVEPDTFINKAEEVGCRRYLYVRSSYNNNAFYAERDRGIKGKRSERQIYHHGRRRSCKPELCRSDRRRLLYTGCSYSSRSCKESCYREIRIFQKNIISFPKGKEEERDTADAVSRFFLKNRPFRRKHEIFTVFEIVNAIRVMGFMALL